MSMPRVCGRGTETRAVCAAHPETPVVAICTPGPTYSVMASNIKEMKARRAPVIALGVDGDKELAEIVDIFIPIPNTHLWCRC